MTDLRERWEAKVVGTDDDPGLLGRYFMGIHRGMIYTFCKRCPNVQVVVRDLAGDQTDLTLGELVKMALEHERDEHQEGHADDV